MGFEPPEASTAATLAALNRSFLELVARDRGLDKAVAVLPGSLQRRLVGLRPSERERLSAVPFLLYSLADRDDGFWSRLLEEPPTGNLFRAAPSPDLSMLVDGTLAFIWHLSRTSPFTLRIACGLSIYDGEVVADADCLSLMDACRRTGQRPSLRAGPREFWRLLLEHGTSRHAALRASAHLCAFQSLLTVPQALRADGWRIAARRMRHPGLKVADDGSSR